jgi:hypothetical protein
MQENIYCIFFACQKVSHFDLFSPQISILFLLFLFFFCLRWQRNKNNFFCSKKVYQQIETKKICKQSDMSTHERSAKSNKNKLKWTTEEVASLELQFYQLRNEKFSFF